MFVFVVLDFLFLVGSSDLVDLSLATLDSDWLECLSILLGHAKAFRDACVHSILSIVLGFLLHLVQLRLDLVHLLALEDVLLDINEAGLEFLNGLIIKDGWLHQVSDADVGVNLSLSILLEFIKQATLEDLKALGVLIHSQVSFCLLQVDFAKVEMRRR